jgi:pimeloyl-ACP methyl ester carboxylesterase
MMQSAAATTLSAELLEGRPENIAIDGERSIRIARYGDPHSKRIMLFDPGSFGIYADAFHLSHALAGRGWYVIAQTRAGMFGSDPLPDDQPPVPRFHVEDMRRLLDRLEIDRRIILAGHSMAGVRLHTAGCAMPERLRGLALLDAVCPALMSGLTWKGWIAWATGIGKTGAYVAGTTASSVMELIHPNGLKLSGYARQDKLASISSSAHLKTAAAEVAATEKRLMEHEIQAALDIPSFIATATPVSQRTTKLLAEYEKHGTWARRLHLPKDGHMSMLTPPSVTKLADGIETLWTNGLKD